MFSNAPRLKRLGTGCERSTPLLRLITCDAATPPATSSRTPCEPLLAYVSRSQLYMMLASDARFTVLHACDTSDALIATGRRRSSLSSNAWKCCVSDALAASDTPLPGLHSLETAAFRCCSLTCSG